MNEHRQASARWLERSLQLTERHHAASVAGVLLLALSVRVLVLEGLRSTPYWDGLSPDEDTYHRWAARIAGGSDAAGFAPDFPRLPARVLGALYGMAGAEVSHARSLNLALGVVACALIYATGRVLYGRTAGLFALLLAAFSESLAFYSATVLHTMLGVVLAAGLVLLAASCLQYPERFLRARFVAAGAVAGMLVNVRGNAVLFALLLIPTAFAASRALARPRRILVPQLLAALALGYLVTASLSGGVLGPRSAFNLYIGNNPDNPTPYFRPVRFTSSAPEHQSTGFVLEAERRFGEPLSLDRAERFWVGVVIDDALERPGAALGRLALKLRAIGHRSPSDNNLDLRVVRDLVPGLGLGLPTWLLLALGIAGVLALPLDRRLALGASGLGLYVASVALFFAGERLRVPLLVIVLPYAGAALAALAHASRRLRVECAAAFVVLGLLAQAPLRGADDLSGAYNMHALLLLGRGELEESARWYRRALALDELDSPGARIGLAAILQQRGRLDEAVAVLEPLPEEHYEAASKHEWLGNLALARQRPHDAVAAYTRAIEYDSSKQNAYQGLFIAHRMLGQDAQARAIDARLAALRERVRALHSLSGERASFPRPLGKAQRDPPLHEGRFAPGNTEP